MGVGGVFQKVWILVQPASCCNVRFASAGVWKCILWEVHIRVQISVPLSIERGGEKSTAGGLAALMDLLACVGLGRLLTKSLRTLISLLSSHVLTLNL